MTGSGRPRRFASERLREARVALGLSQEDAARALSVDVRTYRRYESGAVNAGGPFTVRHASRRALLERMTRELGLSPEELFDDPQTTGTAQSEQGGAGHALPPVARFVGRAALIDDLAQWTSPVTAVIAMGGAGKTSVAAQVVARTPGVFVWSFYQDPRVDRFAEGVLARFGDGPGSGIVERAERALERADAPRLVLDGLEVAQSVGTTARARGELEDPALARLLRGWASGRTGVRALVTSRLPLTDLAPWRGAGYRELALPALGDEDGRRLLAGYGVDATPAALARGAGHALSLAMIGAYTASMLGGDARRMDAVSLAEAATDDALARRLFGVLDAYASGLGSHEREALGLLSVLGEAPAEALAPHTTASIESLARALQRLVALGLAHRGARGFGLHPFVSEFGRRFVEDPRVVHEAERLALRRRGLRSQDDVERLITHTLGAGRPDAAHALYRDELGGFTRLGLELGEMVRGARITRRLAEADLTDDARMSLEYERGLYASALGDLPLALASYARVNALAERLASARFVVTALRTTAYTHRLAGDLDAAEAALAASLALAREARLDGHLARGFALRGAVLTDRARVAGAAPGMLEEAARWFEAARALDPSPEARRSLWAAEHALASGALDRARDDTEQNLAACEARGWPGHVAHCHAVLGGAAARTGRLDDAHEHLRAVRRWTERTGEVEMVLRASALAGLLGDEADAARGQALAARLGFAMPWV